MYKVMIVDDEMLVRIGIRTIINWEERGFQIIAEAGNGEAAYEKYLALKPDVVITDIKMPKKDGLWLTDRIKENNPDTEIVFLTCFDDFSYARAALKKKVSSYILKAEMEEEELGCIMDSIKIRLDQRSSTMQDVAPADHEIRKNEELLLGLLLDVRKDASLVISEFAKHNIKIDQKKFVLLQFDFNRCFKEDESDKDKIAGTISACKEVILNKFNKENGKCVCKQFGKSVTVFYIADHISKTQLLNEIMYCKESIKQYFAIEVKSTSGKIADSIYEIKSSVPWFYKLIDLLFYTRNGEHLWIDEADYKPIKASEFNFRMNDIFLGIEEGNVEKLKKTIALLKTELQEYKIDPFETKFKIAQMISELVSRFEGSTLLATDDYSAEQEVMRSEDIEDVKSNFEEFCFRLIRFFDEFSYNNRERLVEKAVRYIYDHYFEKLTLDEVAKHVGISKYYLSALFKKEKDINFSIFLNQVRIEKAKVLLKQKNKTIPEVYCEVGYSDQQYFSKTFKKYVGMTITEYRAK